jgi:hypothetical protein
VQKREGNYLVDFGKRFQVRLQNSSDPENWCRCNQHSVSLHLKGEVVRLRGLHRGDVGGLLPRLYRLIASGVETGESRLRTSGKNSRAHTDTRATGTVLPLPPASSTRVGVKCTGRNPHAPKQKPLGIFEAHFSF